MAGQRQCRPRTGGRHGRRRVARSYSSQIPGRFAESDVTAVRSSSARGMIWAKRAICAVRPRSHPISHPYPQDQTDRVRRLRGARPGLRRSRRPGGATVRWTGASHGRHGDPQARRAAQRPAVAQCRVAARLCDVHVRSRLGRLPALRDGWFGRSSPRPVPRPLVALTAPPRAI
jgi:hypothetical protein